MTAKETLSESPVEASLLAKASGQSAHSLNDTAPSLASQRLQVWGPTLDFAEVSLTLGRTTILDKVTFQVQPGSVHALVGPNGGGKSSLIKTLLGQMPHQGRLSLQWPGTPGTIGYVPQA
jgi:zinc transport system ATP-binding protein